MSKILVIEDDEILRETMAQFLAEEGFDVSIAIDGEDGVNKALTEKPDLILCDINLPKFDGFEVYKRLEDNELIVPFIFVTARTEVDDIRNGMLLGADDYITKPFRIDTLMSIINKRLQKRENLEKEYKFQIKKSEAIIDYLKSQLQDKNIKLDSVKNLFKNVATLDLGMLKFIGELLEKNKDNIKKEIFEGADWLEAFLGMPEALHTIIADITTVVNLFLTLRVIRHEDLKIENIKDTFFYEFINKIYYQNELDEDTLNRLLKYVKFEDSSSSGGIIEF